MNCENRLKKECFDNVENFIKGLEEKKGSLITVLHHAQGVFGYLPHEVQKFVAEKLEIPLSKVYGVVSFYHYFKMVPQGKYPVAVCMGTACYVRGAEKVLRDFEARLGIKVGETTEDGMFSIDALRCVGACGLAPVVLVGEDVIGKEEATKVAEIIERYKTIG